MSTQFTFPLNHAICPTRPTVQAQHTPRSWSDGGPASSITPNIASRSYKERTSPQSHTHTRHLVPLTLPSRDSPVVQALGISSSLTLKLDDPPFQLTHSDLVRYRSRARSPLGQHRLASQSRTSKDGGIMTIAEACWIKWEEETGICRKLGYAFDEKGDAYKPDITYVQAIRLVIAASPRRMLTLSQIYDAIEERWPWHKTSGQTWKNSVRHNLSLNKCFVKVDRPTNDGGIKKGSYWTVDDSLSGQTARRTRKGASTTIITPRIEPPYVVPSRVSKEQATNTLASGGIFAWKSPHFVPHEVRRTSRGVEHTRPWHDVPFDR